MSLQARHASMGIAMDLLAVSKKKDEVDVRKFLDASEAIFHYLTQDERSDVDNLFSNLN